MQAPSVGTSFLRSWERIPLIQKGLRVVGSVLSAKSISLSRVPLSAAAVILDQMSHTAGAVTYAVSCTTDALDGAVARATNTVSKSGMLYDTLCDKLGNLIPLTYQIALKIQLLLSQPDTTGAAGVFIAGAASSMACNVVSQAQRGAPREQFRTLTEGEDPSDGAEHMPQGENVRKIQANIWGKSKQIIECLSLLAVMGKPDNPVVMTTAGIGLFLSSLLTLKGTCERARVAEGH
ncbi:MAG: CDP-alcohol phosphatidyltransferase family protein [Candidatus Peribacteraceae bacterium]